MWSIQKHDFNYIFGCRSICKSYMRNSVGCILMFDVSQRQTFDRIGSWHQEVLDYVKPNPMFFLLVGHKSDLAVGRQVRKSEGEALAKKLNMITYLEVSTKENLNVSEVFETLSRGIYDLFKKGKIATRDDWHGLTVGATVDKEPQVAEKSKCCNFGWEVLSKLSTKLNKYWTAFNQMWSLKGTDS